MFASLYHLSKLDTGTLKVLVQGYVYRYPGTEHAHCVQTLNIGVKNRKNLKKGWDCEKTVLYISSLSPFKSSKKSMCCMQQCFGSGSALILVGWIRLRIKEGKEAVLWNRNRNRRNRNFLTSGTGTVTCEKVGTGTGTVINYGSGNGTRNKIMYLISFINIFVIHILQ